MPTKTPKIVHEPANANWSALMTNTLEKDQSASSAQRQARLMEHLRNQASFDRDLLPGLLGVSVAVIESDLAELQSRGLLKRGRTGDLIVSQSTLDYDTSIREMTNTEEKARIGAAAVDFIVEGDSVMIDSGTTSLQVATRLAGRPSLTFVTNGTDTLSVLKAAGAGKVYLVGGEYIDLNHSLGGPIAVDSVRGYSVDKAILSVAAVDLERGVIATTSPQIGAVQQAMIGVARTVIVVADHSKFDRTALSVIAPLHEIDHIVTDEATRPLVRNLPAAMRAKFVFA
ncbi:DeoR/GlpR family DNA-binding transcription regulator [Rhizobium sp. NPDC090275]|uniref:DeoR/GlpR family DNA-binding transcription regulator n=1 Tax=Rhizobium sp. NPDC090275 TaxID=3364498 RepID=UPI00383AF551